MSHEWTELAWEGCKYGAGAAAALCIKWAYGKSRRLYVRSSGMKLEFPDNRDPVYGGVSRTPIDGTRVGYSVEVRFFSRKPIAIALHECAIEFRSGWLNGHVKARDRDLQCDSENHQRRGSMYQRLAEFLIPPEQWVVQKVHGSLEDYEGLRRTTVWFSATTAEGAKKRWLIARILVDFSVVQD
jgi:hypothetical protein